MNNSDDSSYSIRVAKQMASDLAEFAKIHDQSITEDTRPSEAASLPPGDPLLVEYDVRITNVDLRTATRSRFASSHYADAVEAGVKALNKYVRSRTGRTEDGDSLMTLAFSPNAPLLRINSGRSKSEESTQRGHMFLCQGVVGAWRNPRAHTNIADTPERALMMLETINELIEITKTATRTRKQKKS
jgi:uncharacterized protein (TIGR02391 family)